MKNQKMISKFKTLKTYLLIRILEFNILWDENCKYFRKIQNLYIEKHWKQNIFHSQYLRPTKQKILRFLIRDCLLRFLNKTVRI